MQRRSRLHAEWVTFPADLVTSPAAGVPTAGPRPAVPVTFIADKVTLRGFPQEVQPLACWPGHIRHAPRSLCHAAEVTNL